MNLKEQAAHAAADLVENGMTLGLGTGTTASLLVLELGRRLRDGSLRGIRGVPTSIATAQLAEEEGIPLVTLHDASALSLTLDGADEVDPEWNLIKGGGGSLLREKIVAQASHKEVILIDEGKLVSNLGEKMPLPVEVVPFGWSTHEEFFESLGGKPVLRKNRDGSTFITDEGNFTLDVHFADVSALAAPWEIQQEILGRAGIIDTGFFLGMTSVLVVARESGVEVLDQRP